MEHEQIQSVIRLISRERLSKYLTMHSGDEQRALQSYRYNRRLSACLYEICGGFEIALRNSMHLTLSQAFGDEVWFDHLPFLWLPYEQNSLDGAKKALHRRGRTITAGRVIAELTLGFWCGLTAPPYEQKLWIPHLHKAFPMRKLGRKAASRRLDEIRKFRNRIAHHECILHLDPQAHYNKILETVGWICPSTQRWLEEGSNFSDILANPLGE